MLDRFASARPRRLSCGIVVLLASRELLLCHVTGQRQWDLPKGGIHAGETPLEAAQRETREETGLSFAAEVLLDLGRHAYTAKKDLHLFACLSARIDPRELHCASCFVERTSGRARPEMDGFGWFSFDRIASLCTPRLATLLTRELDLDAIVARLDRAGREPLAA
jgi:putative (di)nucleoside polyphosphate hydrolase